VLKKWVEVDDESPDAYLRLMELSALDNDWNTVARNVERYLAVNPLVAPPYRYLARASAALGNDSAAVVAWRTLYNWIHRIRRTRIFSSRNCSTVAAKTERRGSMSCSRSKTRALPRGAAPVG